MTPAVLGQVKTELLDKGLAPQTVVHYLKFLRHVLNVAVRDGKLLRNPFLQVRMPAVPKGRLRFLSLDDEQALCEKIGEPYAQWVRLAILTGLRIGEFFGLRWADVDHTRQVLTLPATKTGGVQYAHLNDEALAIIERLKAGNRSVWVFPSNAVVAFPRTRQGKHEKPRPPRKQADTPRDPTNFYHRVYLPAVRAAGLEGVTFHTLRHTFASRLAMAGATEGEIAAALRHSSTALVKRYAHLSPAHLKGVVEKVSAFGKAPAPPASTPTVEPSEIGEKSEEEGSSQTGEKIGAGDGI